jgi:alpha-galactosidase
MDAAEAIINQGLNKLGYEYVNMDDCWAEGRYTNGTVYPDPTSFPNGIKSVADYVHSLGLKFGIYTDRGNQTCAGRPGSFGFEKIDADTYASWGVDYLKEDSCYATNNHAQAFQQYATMRDALNRTGRPIFFSLCGWNSWYSPVGWSLGNSWRIAGDCNHWPDVINAINVNSNLEDNARPGGWNDPDMLLGSNPKAAANLPPTQSRTMFTMWCVMTAPLLLGSSNFDAFDLQTYTNKELIAVNQDPLGIQGKRIKGTNLTFSAGPMDDSHVNIWAKPLSAAKAFAVVFINTASVSGQVKCDFACFQAMGYKSGDVLTARDLWQHAVVNNNVVVTSGFTTAVPANGGSVAILFNKK